ncbi:MAG: Pr6Pr family membrane protein [Micrococcus sp.]|nr:Pr6Pr family membrane protein [Micrococcus sp.]
MTVRARPRSAGSARRTLARVAHGVVGGLCLLGSTMTSLYIASTKVSELPVGAGYTHQFAAGWEHVLNQPAYFTFMSNALVGVTSLLLAIRPEISSPTFRVLRLAGLSCLVITGVVFNVLLRDGASLPGVETINDTVSHVITPVLAPLVWLAFGPRGLISWRTVAISAAIPLAWLAVTLLRGPLIDWYPYTILDVPKLGYAGVSGYIGAIFAGYFAVAGVFWGLDRLLLRVSGEDPTSGKTLQR